MKPALLLVLGVLVLAVACAGPAEVATMKELDVTSPAFAANSMIPETYTCDGEDVSPPLHIEHIPANTKSLILIMDDPDAPSGTWVHWVVYDIPVRNDIAEDTIPGVQGRNSFKRQDYGGPCPPSGTHRYYFKVYALNTMLNLPQNSTKDMVEEAMHGHVVAQGELMARYSKQG